MTVTEMFAPIPPPAPVDEIRYECDSGTETMTLRAGRQFVVWPYTITDCYSVDYVKRSLFGGSKKVRCLDTVKLEEKRREMFAYAYGLLCAAQAVADARPGSKLAKS